LKTTQKYLFTRLENLETIFGYFSNIVFAFDSSDTKIAGLASKAIDVTQSFAALS